MNLSSSIRLSGKPGAFAKQRLSAKYRPERAIVARSPYYAYRYASATCRRFPEGEAAIATDPQWAYQYAFYILGKRFPEGEPAVLESPKWAYRYALNVINKGLLPSNFHSRQGHSVRRGRWPEAEPIIATHPEYSFWYARDVIGGKFPAGEAVMRGTTWWNDYLMIP